LVQRPQKVSYLVYRQTIIITSQCKR